MKDVVVLGAGMVGTGSALALQARGFNVLLLDRSPPGSETSYGNAGIIQGEACEPYALPRDIRTLCRFAMKADNSVDWDVRGLWRSAPSLVSYWRNSAPAKHRQLGSSYAALARRATQDHDRCIAASGAEDLIRRGGYRVVFRDHASFDLELRKAERMRSAYGIGFDREDRSALVAAEPALRGPLVGAIRWHDAWTCRDPAELVRAYSRLFTKRAGELLKSEILGLRQSGSGWTLQTSTGTIDAAHIVVAMGPWAPQLLAPLGYKVLMVPKRGYHLQFEYLNAASRLDLPILDAAFGAVYVPMRAGLRIATGADLSAERQRQPRQLRRAEAAARELLDIGEPIESSLWAGVRPCMPDMLPLVGAAPWHRGLWFNFGHGHQGFTLGPTTGELLAEAMAPGSVHPVPALAPARLFH